MTFRRLFRPGRDDPSGVSCAEATRPDRRFDLFSAHTAHDIETVQTLFREYQQWLGVNLCFQGFEEELATLPGRYAPPLGRLLLAWEGEQPAGCVALRPLESGVGEMKRLFVRPAYRGQGLGRVLAVQIVNEATALGYAVMRLDTLDTLEHAMQLYETLGFQRCAPYYANPLPGVVYWERVLANPLAGAPDCRLSNLPQDVLQRPEQWRMKDEGPVGALNVELDRSSMNHFWRRLKKPFFVLAPMADVTDIVFRHFVLRHSRPDVVYTEFMACKELLSPKSRERFIRDFGYSEQERPIVAQVFGSEPDDFFAAAQRIRVLGFDGMDINMGCPDRRVEKQGAGAHLMRDPQRAQMIIQAAKAGLDGLPLTVKTRLGYYTIETASWIGAVLEAKPDVLVLHGRTRQELSQGPAHWDEIALAASMAHDAGVLCVGNGDLQSREQGEEYAQYFGVDGLMIGRGVWGNPWVFAPRAERSEPEKLIALAHLITQFSGFWKTTKNDSRLKKHFKGYVEGFPGSKALCGALLESRHAMEAIETLSQYFHDQGWVFPDGVYEPIILSTSIHPSIDSAGSTP